MTFSKMLKTALAASILVTCASASATVYKFSDGGVSSDAHIKGMEIFNLELNRLSDGKDSLKVYHSGQLLNKTAEITSIRRGDGKVNFIFMDLNYLVDYVPSIGMLASPYLFNSPKQMLEVLNGPLGNDIRDRIAKKTGMRMLDAFYLGTRNLNLKLKEGQTINVPSDLAKVKLRMPGSKSWQHMGSSLGATPTPLAFPEVYMGLMTGTINAQDNPLPTTKNAKFYEVTNSIVLTNHFINPLYVAVNDKWWEKQSSEQKKIILEALSISTKGITQEVLKTEKELISFFESKDMNVTTPNNKAFRDYSRAYYKDNGLTEKWDKALFKKITEQ